MSNAPLIDILVLNWNGYELTKNCIESLLKINYENHRIILVDNHSTDQSIEKLGELFKNLIIIESDRNLGYASGNNLGSDWILKDQKSAFTLVLNNDTTVDPNFLPPLLKKFDESASTGLVCPVIFYMEPQDKRLIWALGGTCNFWIGKFRSNFQRVEYPQIKEKISAMKLDYISGCCFLIKNELIREIGLFKENYFTYYEDTDLSYRIKKAGYTLEIAEQSFIRHVAGGSRPKNGKKSPLSWYLSIRNQLWFFKRHSSFYHVFTYGSMKTFEIIYLILSFSTFRFNLRKLRSVFAGALHGIFLNENSFDKKIPI